MHTPFVQVFPSGHWNPHAPQFCTSLLRSVQVPSHSCTYLPSQGVAVGDAELVVVELSVVVPLALIVADSVGVVVFPVVGYGGKLVVDPQVVLVEVVTVGSAVEEMKELDDTDVPDDMDVPEGPDVPEVSVPEGLAVLEDVKVRTVVEVLEL